MKYLLFFIILMSFFSCHKTEKSEKLSATVPRQDSLFAISKNEPVLSDEEILKQQNESEKELSKIIEKYVIEKQYKNFNYKIFCEKQQSGIIGFKKLVIRKNNKLFQEINIPKDSAFIYYDYEFDFSADEDWNFDGFEDIKLIKFHGMRDAEYNLWLFNKEKNTYEYCSSFGNITNPVMNKKTQEITSQYHAGPTTYYYFAYKFKYGKFVETYSDVKGEGD